MIVYLKGHINATWQGDKIYKKDINFITKQKIAGKRDSVII